MEDKYNVKKKETIEINFASTSIFDLTIILKWYLIKWDTNKMIIHCTES